MRGRRKVSASPQRGPEQSETAGDNENPAPIQKQKYQSYQWRREITADGCSGVDDAHGSGTFADGEPFGDDARGGRKASSFSDAEQEAAGGQREDPNRKGVARASERPENHNQRKAAARAERVSELSASGIHEGVCQKEHRGQIGELFMRERDVFVDGLECNGDCLPVEVADGDGSAYEYGDAPAQQVWLSLPSETEKRVITIAKA